MNTKPSKTIKELPKVERPREKLVRYGPEKLSDSEPSADDLAMTKRAGRIR